MSLALGEVWTAKGPLGQPRHVACPSSCISMRTSFEEGIKLHRFAGIFPEQFLTEAGRYREAVVAADQRMVIRCYGDDLASFVHDVSHVSFFGGSRAAALTWIMFGKSSRRCNASDPSCRGVLCYIIRGIVRRAGRGSRHAMRRDVDKLPQGCGQAEGGQDHLND